MKRGDFEVKSGAPGGARTHHLLLRRQSLYPNELRVHGKNIPLIYFKAGENQIFSRKNKEKQPRKGRPSAKGTGKRGKNGEETGKSARQGTRETGKNGKTLDREQKKIDFELKSGADERT